MNINNQLGKDNNCNTNELFHLGKKNSKGLSLSTRNVVGHNCKLKMFTYSNANLNFNFNCNSNYNVCPGKEKCPNVDVIKELKQRIKNLVHVNKELKEMNVHLQNGLIHKEEAFQRLLQDNLKMKSQRVVTSSNNLIEESNVNSLSAKVNGESSSKIKIISSRLHSHNNKKHPKLKLKEDKLVFNFTPYKPQRMFSLKSKDNDYELNNLNYTVVCNNNHNMMNVSYKNNYSSNKKRKKSNMRNNEYFPVKIYDSSNHKSNHIVHLYNSNYNSSYHTPNYEDSNKISPLDNSPINNHYDKLSAFSNQEKLSSYLVSNISFLSATNDKLNQMADNPILNELHSLAQYEDTFIANLSEFSPNKLLLYCESLLTLTSEYKSLIKLILRVKEFLHASIKLLDSVLQSDISNAFMNNTCTILHCDRSSLFLYDKTTDSLIASYAEGLKQNSIKVPKNKGVVGYVFTTGEKVKIDDAYKDPRFNKEIDIKTNYKTKNILCYPLKNKDGKIFGAIQAINKHNGAFDIDDLALMDFFSEQASALLQNRFNINEHTTMLSQMKILCQFSNDIMGIKDKIKFTKKSEECLQSLFYSSLNKVMLTNNFTKELEYYFEDSHSLDSGDNKHIVDLLGIIGYVWKRKEIYGCLSVKTNKYYNKLVDLNSSDALITVPIMNEYNEIIAMVQIVSPSKVNDKTGKLIHTDMIILELFEKCVLSWYNANYCK